MQTLLETLHENFKDVTDEFGEITLIVDVKEVKDVCQKLRDDFYFDTLIDICGVDYSAYGDANWQTTTNNFIRSRQVETTTQDLKLAVVYHLLSVKNNQRLRVKTHLGDDLMLESVIDIWCVANWYEREAFDMFGILFENHPDLRRILTDYGFIGHPLRKDFPTHGELEMSYDETLKRVVYKPVSIKMKENVPRVIRD